MSYGRQRARLRAKSSVRHHASGESARSVLGFCDQLHHGLQVAPKRLHRCGPIRRRCVGAACFGQYPDGHSGETWFGFRQNSRISHCAMRACSSSSQAECGARLGVFHRASCFGRPFSAAAQPTCASFPSEACADVPSGFYRPRDTTSTARASIVAARTCALDTNFWNTSSGAIGIGWSGRAFQAGDVTALNRRFFGFTGFRRTDGLIHPVEKRLAFRAETWLSVSPFTPSRSPDLPTAAAESIPGSKPGGLA